MLKWEECVTWTSEEHHHVQQMEKVHCLDRLARTRFTWKWQAGLHTDWTQMDWTSRQSCFVSENHQES